MDLEIIADDELPELVIITWGNRTKFDWDKTYYLAGPMSGYPGYNFVEFTNACNILRAAGVLVKSPHEIDHGETEETRGSLPYETYMQAGLDLLKECQGIILLRGWPQSTGACREVSQAISSGLPLYFFNDAMYGDDVELIDMNRKPEA